MNPEDKIADAAYTNARATVDAGDKIVEAIDRNTAAIDRNTAMLEKMRNSVGSPSIWIALIWIGLCVVGCPRAKTAPLVSDGDEIASVGTEVRR